MKFIHFADAHLDSPFRGLSFLPSKEFNQIYQAADQSLIRIVDLALAEKVDLVLIAGDTFDSAKPSPRSQLLFAEQIKRLTDAQIQVVMIFGNHDHMRREDLLVNQSPYFKLLGADEVVEKASFKTKDNFNYDVVGFSYLNNHITEDKIPDFPEKGQNYTFGLMHAQEKETDSSKNVYAPFTVAEVQALNYDYFALGHIHARRNLSEKPWIVYSGNIQGRHINEMGAKGCYLGVIDESTKKTSIEFKATGPILWQGVQVELDAPISKADLQNRIIASLNNAEQKTYFSLTIAGAQFMTEEEQELIQDTDFWQNISQNLSFDSQLVDVRLKISSNLELNENDQQAFEQAKSEIFKNDEFDQIVSDWKKKDPLSAQLAEDPAFIDAVKQLTEVKLMGKLKGITDETETN
ncbi:metallophosphoesterase family protein [Lactobacillus helveticus]|jgi:DNA repair protein SbcD/Mre11|uniref:Exonuclease SbcCD, D subunit n=2 Tax=Lactobacillus helveticus TaxID=1587 RepID=U4QMI4_LACHE|nr:exonuclease SbcCD subunit D [Lactobacillus helveticus]ADX69736.1 Putative phosphoesterase or DNA repair exonuclease [Lactobacillus helveticus H10]NRN75220.1 putative metallophosphoesterase YhaO [Lactobacillus helveticus]NRN77105.1 putative metallophosphoesterase YhaO [Lactobacillus helveticus]NRN79376.1 putative metallophosphoesterase YhaO [Lactobacillus helveticus]NRN81456.1 putative metallophosphoesterase YhaO [Lactobacillus helveticus]